MAASTHLRLIRSTAPNAPIGAEVVARAQQGDSAAQAELFRGHAPRLLRLLRYLLASNSDAEDALQDTFLSAFRDLAQLEELSAFAGWLRQIAVHQAHRHFRRRRIWRTFGLDRKPTDATLAQLSSPHTAPEVRAELAMVDRELHKLPTNERMAWMLRYVEGWELTEVAVACHCSLATVKRRINRARARLVKYIDLPEYNNE